MPAKPTSDLRYLMKLLRRILVLAVAAYGLASNVPYLTLISRLAILWAVLYLTALLVEVAFRVLSSRSGLPAPAEPAMRVNPTSARGRPGA